MKGLLVTLVFVVAAAALATLFVGGSGRARDDTANASPLDADYDYYVQDMQATRFGADGTPVSRLRAERVTHYPDGDRAELVNPALEAFGSDPWQASALTGTLAPDPERTEDRLDLAGDVELRKPLDESDFIEMNTSALTVFTTSEEAVSTAPVVLRMHGTHLDGVGLQARLAENSFHLNDSKGTHDPSPNP